MSGDITDYANVNVSASAPAITQKTFALALFITHNATWTELTREYKKPTDVAADWGLTTPEYLMLAAFFAQSPRPPSALLGRATDHKPTQQFEFTPVIKNNYTYKMKIAGQIIAITSDGSATNAEVNGALKTAIDALSLPVTTSLQSSNAVLRVVSTTPGAFVAIGTLDRANLPVVQNHANPGIELDLASIATERNDWYALHTGYNSAAYVEAAAAYCATNGKLYVAQTIDTVVPETALSGTDDVAEFLLNTTNDYAKIVYSDFTDTFLDAGMLGGRLAKAPGRATWEYTQLSGIAGSTFTATERANMLAKRVSWYEATEGVVFFNNSKLSSGRFVDFRIYLDYFKSRTQEKMLRKFLVNDKIGDDDAGISIIAGCVKAQLKEDSTGPNHPVDPNSIVVSSPLAADQPDADRADRVLNGVGFAYRYVSPIHKANVDGVATL